MRIPAILAVVVCASVFAAMPAAAQSVPLDQQPAEHHHHGAPSEPDLYRSREGSGTSWLPAETPMYAAQYSAGAWSVMIHGSLFGQFLYEPGDKHRTGGVSNEQVSSVNWAMLMARRTAGAGRVGLRAMASGEPWTVHDCGFINLLANGEMCEGDTIHDRQHPHDLVMELAADYERPVRSMRWQVYGGLAGEPALGPAAFPHRVSSMPNPIAPITHHWMDSTHITYGLVTTGLSRDRWKAEVSVFNAREPDDDRADLDLGALDSVSGRLTFLPNDRWALQASAGHLNAAEAEFPPEPRSDVDRATASATYHRVTPSRVWATTLGYGLNAGRELIPGGSVYLVTHAGLAESALTIRERHAWFGRVEVVGKPGHDLHVHEAPATVFTVGKLQAGYVRYFSGWRHVVAGVGGTASMSIVPSALASRYSGRVAPGLGVYVTLRPKRHEM